MAPLPSLTSVTLKVAGLACGWAYRELEPIMLEATALNALCGSYRFDKGDWTLTREGDTLALESGWTRTTLLPLSPTEFFLKSEPFNRVRFTLGPNGTATALEVRGRYALRIERGVKVEQG
jgi:hypothetical protein